MTELDTSPAFSRISISSKPSADDPQRHTIVGHDSPRTFQSSNRPKESTRRSDVGGSEDASQSDRK